MKRLWVVRAGRSGEREDKALALERLMPGFEDVPALTGRTDRDSIIEVLRDTFPDDGENRRRNLAAQLNQFVNTMQAGDLVVMPLKQAPQVAIGRVTGNYLYDAEFGHTRAVEWLRPDTPRDAFQQDLLYSFGAFLTVCEVRRNNAYMRTLAVAERKVDPGPVKGGMGPPGDRSLTIEGDESDAESVPTNLDVLARDQIRKHVAAAFAGHGLTRLVDFPEPLVSTMVFPGSGGYGWDATPITTRSIAIAGGEVIPAEGAAAGRAAPCGHPWLTASPGVSIASQHTTASSIRTQPARFVGRPFTSISRRMAAACFLMSSVRPGPSTRAQIMGHRVAEVSARTTSYSRQQPLRLQRRLLSMHAMLGVPCWRRSLPAWANAIESACRGESECPEGTSMSPRAGPATLPLTGAGAAMTQARLSFRASA
jgi:hypothetical protein